MSSAAISVFVFGIYSALVGIGFLFLPNKVLPMFKFPKTNEPWIRVMGTVVALVAFYYIIAAQNEIAAIFWASIIGRFAIFVSFVLLVVTKKAKPMLISFGVIDAAGAIWTFLTLN